MRLKKHCRYQIIKNHLNSSNYLQCVSIGMKEGAEIEIIFETPFSDYVIVQVHKKIFALPRWMMEEIEVKA